MYLKGPRPSGQTRGARRAKGVVPLAPFSVARETWNDPPSGTSEMEARPPSSEVSRASAKDQRHERARDSTSLQTSVPLESVRTKTPPEDPSGVQQQRLRSPRQRSTRHRLRQENMPRMTRGKSPSDQRHGRHVRPSQTTYEHNLKRLFLILQQPSPALFTTCLLLSIYKKRAGATVGSATLSESGRLLLLQALPRRQLDACALISRT